LIFKLVYYFLVNYKFHKVEDQLHLNTNH